MCDTCGCRKPKADCEPKEAECKDEGYESGGCCKP